MPEPRPVMSIGKVDPLIDHVPLATFLLLAGGLLILYFLRFCVHQHAFDGMSKTRRRKILRTQTRWSRLWVTYGKDYNRPRRARWCLLWYRAYAVSLTLVVGLLWVGLYWEPALSGVALIFVLYYAPYLCILSFLPVFDRRKK